MDWALVSEWPVDTKVSHQPFLQKTIVPDEMAKLLQQNPNIAQVSLNNTWWHNLKRPNIFNNKMRTSSDAVSVHQTHFVVRLLHHL